MSIPEPRSGERLRRQYCFGEFTLDLERGMLLRGGELVPLRPKSFEVLTYLVEHHGRIVAKSTLIEAVWPDTAVGDNSLAQCLFDIRRALGDDSQQLIQTAPRRGYIFAASVTSPVLEFPLETSPLPVEPRPRYKRLFAALGLAAIAMAGLVILLLRRPVKQEPTYQQITNFTDSAVSPALSPDGRMLAFLRSDSWFLSPDQIYVKMLPNGDAVQVTHDPRPKYGLSFSPDGSLIGYTVASSGWNTFTVSPLGGEPKLLLSNAAGLMWLDEHRLLFSEIRTGNHMGVVMATESRAEYRRIYFPQDERGMAHLAYASPDRKWALVVEMNPVWQPCRLIPLDGSSAGRQVGPQGKCNSAAWSPDGKWMYLGVDVEGNQHLWRQRFPNGEPEQITSGPTEAEGVAVAPDGRSLITSIGMRQGAVWVHDSRGERPISSEGYVLTSFQSGLFGSQPRFSRDGAAVFSLRRASPEAPIELWKTDLASGNADNVAPGFSILEYDLSTDEKELVFSAQPAGKASQIWLATLDRSSPPKLIAASGENSPYFGPDGYILYRLSDGKTHYAARMRRDGSGRSKLAPYPIGNVQTVSADRRWIVSIMPSPDGKGAGTMAVPIDGGSPRRICTGACSGIRWAADGKFLYLNLQASSQTSAGKTLVIPLPHGEVFPTLPPAGIRGLEDAPAFPGFHVIEASTIAPGPDPSIYAYVKTTVHRNLFRIPLRD